MKTDIDTYLKEVLKRCEAAMSGPWKTVKAQESQHGIPEEEIMFDVVKETKTTEIYSGKPMSFFEGPIKSVFHEHWGMKKEDADFIANSRADLPRLARYCLKLREALKVLGDIAKQNLDLEKSDKNLKTFLEPYAVKFLVDKVLSDEAMEGEE